MANGELTTLESECDLYRKSPNTATFSSAANTAVTLKAWFSQRVNMLPRLSMKACGPCDVPAQGIILATSGSSVLSETYGASGGPKRFTTPRSGWFCNQIS